MLPTLRNIVPKNLVIRTVITGWMQSLQHLLTNSALAKRLAILSNRPSLNVTSMWRYNSVCIAEYT
jgi:hypothetical protein